MGAAETATAEKVWPDLGVRRTLQATYLHHAADTIGSGYPDHIWPSHNSGEARPLDPSAVQAGFVSGIRFACSLLHDMANEASSDADTIQQEQAAAS